MVLQLDRSPGIMGGLFPVSVLRLEIIEPFHHVLYESAYLSD